MEFNLQSSPFPNSSGKKLSLIQYFAEKCSTSSNNRNKELIFDKTLKFYPGALVKYSKSNQDYTFITNIHQKEFRLRINKATDKEAKFITSDLIMDVSPGNVDKAIHELISSLPNNTNSFSISMCNIENLSELKVKLGLSIQSQDIAEFINSFDFGHKKYNTNALISIENEYFTLDFDYIPENGYLNFFDEDVNLSQIKFLIKEDEIPLFVSNVKYGGKIFISIQTNMKYDKLKAEINLNGLNLMNIDGFIKNIKENTSIHTYFHVIGFPVNLSNAFNNNILNEAMSIINDNENFGNPMSYSLYNLSNNSLFSVPARPIEPSEKKNISIIYIIPDGRFKTGVDFSFLQYYRTSNLAINLMKVREKQFNECLNRNNDFLLTYDILMIGGVDGRNNYTELNEYSVSRIADWNNDKGIVLFLHDSIVRNQINLFNALANKLGVPKDVSSPRETRFTSIRLVDNSYNQLLEYPYRILSNEISKTHESTNYNSSNMIISALKDFNAHYFSANLNERVADCSLGHTSEVHPNEQQLFINIIFYLINGIVGKDKNNNENNVQLHGSIEEIPTL